MATVNNNLEVFNNLGLTRQAEANSKAEVSKSDQFMQLMIAQLQNQDPFQPQENGAFLTQLAQFDTASGIKDLQSSFSNFTTTMQSNSALQASTLVGHDVLVPGGDAYLSQGGNVSGTVNLDASTPDLAIEVYDASGQLVRTMSLGQQMSGSSNFNWDGQDNSGKVLPPGVYSIKASAKLGNNNIAQEVLTTAKVDSVSLGQVGQGMKLNLFGMGQVDFGAVTEIR